MGKVADDYCDYIILADEDPYDEDPMDIIEDVQSGIKNKTCEIIIDRALAIEKAVQLGYEWQAKGEKVAVLISGKGTDPYIMGPNGSKVSWSDAKVAESALLKHNNGVKS
jgi:UDP-N-acetylmuramoyl-L-alanyl-D-glutamate--2,6-diaminopimelate ligase